MKASRIFDNGFGDKFEVTCDFTDSLHHPLWKVYVAKKTKGKRKFVALGSTDEQLRYKNIPFEERDKFRYREYLKEIPWSWVEMVMDDVVAEIRKLGNEIYPKDED